MTKYAILEIAPHNRKIGAPTISMNWLCVYSANSTGMVSAGSGKIGPDENALRLPGEDFLYADEARASADVRTFQAANARQVEQTKRCRGTNKTLPSDVLLIEINEAHITSHNGHKCIRKCMKIESALDALKAGV